MNIDMDRLLAQDMLSLTPKSGSFDLEAVAAGIAGIDYSMRDTHLSERFCVAPDAAWRDEIAAARAADPDYPFPLVCTVEVRPDEVLVWPASHTPGLAACSRAVLEWLLGHKECWVENDLGADMLAPAA